jgi:hypothetical protein
MKLKYLSCSCMYLLDCSFAKSIMASLSVPPFKVNLTSYCILIQVFVCGAKQCKRFYHPSCVAKLLVPEAAQNNLACRIQLKLETFTCPLHKCASCNLDEDKTDPSLCLIKCRRCPVAWHEKCLPAYASSTITMFTVISAVCAVDVHLGKCLVNINMVFCIFIVTKR